MRKKIEEMNAVELLKLLTKEHKRHTKLLKKILKENQRIRDEMF